MLFGKEKKRDCIRECPTFTVAFTAVEVMRLLWEKANEQGRLPEGVRPGERFRYTMDVDLCREGGIETFTLIASRRAEE